MNDNRPVEELIRAFLVKTFPAARKSRLDENTPLLESGIIDSLGILSVVSFIEQTFEVHLSDEELTAENFSTVRLLTAFVENKLKPAEVAAK